MKKAKAEVKEAKTVEKPTENQAKKLAEAEKAQEEAAATVEKGNKEELVIKADEEAQAAKEAAEDKVIADKKALVGKFEGQKKKAELAALAAAKAADPPAPALPDPGKKKLADANAKI